MAKAFKDDGTASNEAVVRAIDWLRRKNVDIINMSFSSKDAGERYYDAIKRAYRQGITLISAAGNDGQKSGDTIGYPARFEETIAVTAVDINKKRAPYSSMGEKAEIAAAGTDIYSCFPGNKYARLSGTSMATPIISGAAAIMQAKSIRRFGKKLTPKEVRLLLDMYSEDLEQNGRDNKYGFGVFSFGRITGNDEVIVTPNNQVARDRGQKAEKIAGRGYTSNIMELLPLLFMLLPEEKA